MVTKRICGLGVCLAGRRVFVQKCKLSRVSVLHALSIRHLQPFHVQPFCCPGLITLPVTFSMLLDLGMYPTRYVVGNTATAGSFLSMVKL